MKLLNMGVIKGTYSKFLVQIAFLQIQLILLGGDAFEFSELLDKVTDIVKTNLSGYFRNACTIG